MHVLQACVGCTWHIGGKTEAAYNGPEGLQGRDCAATYATYVYAAFTGSSEYM